MEIRRVVGTLTIMIMKTIKSISLRKIKFAIFGMMIVLIAIGGIAYYQYISSLKYSLLQIRKAYQQHDITLFEKHVDVNTINGNLIDVLLRNIEKSKPHNSDAERIGEELSKGLVHLLKPQLEEVLKRQILKLVETGSFEDMEESNEKGGQFSSLWQKNKNAIFERITEINEKGKVADVKLAFMHPRFDTALTVRIRLRHKGNYWQLFDISDIIRYGEVLEELETKRVNNLNRKVIEEVQKVLQVRNAQMKITSEGYYFPIRYLKYKFEIENISTRTIKDFTLILDINNKYGETVKSLNVPCLKDFFEQGDKFMYSDKRMLYDKDIVSNTLSTNITYATVTFVGGDKIEWNEKWGDEGTVN